MLRFFILLTFIINLNASTINVALASNITYAIPQLVKEFKEQYPNIKVKTTISGSGKLTAQIKHNAPYDIFMSANMKYPQNLYKTGYTEKKPKIYAKGKLALLSYKEYDFLNIKDLLESNNIKKIAIANPKLAPYGKAAIEVLKTLNIYETIKNKIVFAQNISQTLLYTLNVTDIGIVALSSLKSDKLKKYKENKNYIQIDSKLYTPISQGIVLLKRSKNIDDAKKFYNFILSNKAKNIFKNYGYDVL